MVPSLLARRGHNAMPDEYELRSMVLPRFAAAVEMALRDAE